MTEIKNQRMAQVDWLLVIGLIAAQHFEQRLIAVAGGMKVIEQFLTLGLDLGTRQQRGAREQLVFVLAVLPLVHIVEILCGAPAKKALTLRVCAARRGVSVQKCNACKSCSEHARSVSAVAASAHGETTGARRGRRAAKRIQSSSAHSARAPTMDERHLPGCAPNAPQP